MIEPVSILRTHGNNNPVDVFRTLEGPDRVVDHSPVADWEKDLVDPTTEASPATTGENDGSKAHESKTTGQRTVAAISARGERTDRSRVT